MSIIRQLFKLLLKKDVYNKYKNKLPKNSFDEIGQELLKTLEVAHTKFDRDLTTDELLLIHGTENPVITTANKNTIEAYLNNVKEEADVAEDVADLVYQSMWRNECGRFISQFGINFADGNAPSIDGLIDYISTITHDFIPKDFDDPVDTNPVALFDRLNKRGKWKFNIPTLDRKIGNVSPGQFIIILARPESGKTATIVNLMAGKEGFAAQGAKVHLMANEEGADVTAGRAMCCYNEVSFNVARDNPRSLCTEGWELVRRNLVFLHKPEITLSQLEQYCKEKRPDILIIDQLDHITGSANYEKGHERLGAIYRRAREIASKYECVLIAVCQASAEAEGKSQVNFAMAEGSKTAKAATADLIVGVGKVDEASGEEGDAVLRHFHVSKNKISGWKGTVVCRLIQSQSRLTA